MAVAQGHDQGQQPAASLLCKDEAEQEEGCIHPTMHVKEACIEQLPGVRHL